MSDSVHNAIRIHHALASKATDYKKKQHVFRLQTADQSEFLFQTSDSKELQSWIDTINFVCASFSAPPLEGGVGSQKRFQRPLLPSSHTKLLLVRALTHYHQLNQTISFVCFVENAARTVGISRGKGCSIGRIIARACSQVDTNQGAFIAKLRGER